MARISYQQQANDRVKLNPDLEQYRAELLGYTWGETPAQHYKWIARTPIVDIVAFVRSQLDHDARVIRMIERNHE